MKKLIICLLSVLALETYAQEDVQLMGVGFNVANLEASEQFYRALFGLTRTFRFPPEGDLLEIGLGRPGGGAQLILAHLNDDPLPDEKAKYGRLVFNVKDARAIAAQAQARGSTLRDISPPGPGNPVIIFLLDPDGYDVELYQAP